MRELFKVLPLELFRPLAAPGAPVYVGVLLTLFAATRRHNQPLSRELVIQIVSEILSDPEALSATEDVEEIDEVSGNGVIEDEAERVGQRSSKVLRALVRYGWLRVETQSDFTQNYTLPDYAFRLLETIEMIAANEAPPLRGMICAIHDLLQAAIKEGSEHIRVPEAHRQSLRLMNALKELQHNIGAHIEQVLRRLQASEILQQFFTDYRQEIVDRAYHQLRTTDHVSRFRPATLAALAQLSRNEKLLPIAHRLRDGGEAESVESAVNQLLDQMREIRECFDGLDRLLEAIDARHSQFVNSAVRAVELQLTAGSTTSGQLHKIISHLLSKQPATYPASLAPPEYHRLISIFELGLIDEQSLAPPTRAATPFVPETTMAPLLSDEEIAAAQRLTLQQLNRAVSRERLRRFAAELLGERDEMRGAEINITGPDDLPLLIYLRNYGDGSLGYTVEDLPEAAWIERDGVGFRDFVLKNCSSPVVSQ
jgi:hypothetical protein